MLKSKTVIALVLVAVMLLSTGTVYGKETTSQDLNVKTVEVSQKSYKQTTNGTANVEFLNSVDVKWEGSSVTFKEFLVRPGRTVKKGDVIATMEVASNKADLASLEIQYSQKCDEVELSKQEKLMAIKDAKREAENLTSHELTIANQKIRKLQIAYDEYVYKTDKEIATLKQKIETMKYNAANDKVYAPFDGMVRSVASLDQGDTISNGKTILTMFSTDDVLVKISSDKLRYNMKVFFSAGKPGEQKDYTGIVVSADNVLPDSMDTDYALVKLQQTASAFELSNIKYYCDYISIPNVLQVSRNAVFREEGKRYVQILEGGAIKKRYVQVDSGDSDHYWVLNGLKDGQILVTD